ncbi:MAG: sulfotransferase [Aliidongia sp.]
MLRTCLIAPSGIRMRNSEAANGRCAPTQAARSIGRDIPGGSVPRYLPTGWLVRFVSEDHTKFARQNQLIVLRKPNIGVGGSAEYAESFRYYERGNALKKSEIRYRPEPIDRNIRLQVELFTPEFLAARHGVGCDRPDPIFIVGLPRAGSTLLEQILASHSQVEGTMELADITRAGAAASGPGAE